MAVLEKFITEGRMQGGASENERNKNLCLQLSVWVERL